MPRTGLDLNNVTPHDSTKVAARTLSAAVEAHASKLAEATKEAAATPPTVEPMEYFVGDRIVVAVLGLQASLSLVLGTYLLTVSVDCFVPSGYSDATGAYVSSWCASEHARGGEFTFFTFLQSLTLSLPLMLFYQLQGRSLARHVQQLTNTVAALSKKTDEEITGFAVPKLDEQFKAKQTKVTELQTERPVSDIFDGGPDEEDGQEDPYEGGDDFPDYEQEEQMKYEEQFNKERDQRVAQTLQELLLEDAPRDAFDHAVAVVGMGRYFGSWDSRNQWAASFYLTVWLHLAAALTCLGLWLDKLQAGDHFHFSADGEEWRGVEIRRNAFVCPVLLKSGDTATMSFAFPNLLTDWLEEDLLCVYPPRYLLFCAYYINVALVSLLVLVAVGRLLHIHVRWHLRQETRCKKIFSPLPDDQQLLFDACDLSNPDVMRVKSWAVFQHHWNSVETRISKRNEQARANLQAERERRAMEDELVRAASVDYFFDELTKLQEKFKRKMKLANLAAATGVSPSLQTQQPNPTNSQVPSQSPMAQSNADPLTSLAPASPSGAAQTTSPPQGAALIASPVPRRSSGNKVAAAVKAIMQDEDKKSELAADGAHHRLWVRAESDWKAVGDIAYRLLRPPRVTSAQVDRLTKTIRAEDELAPFDLFAPIKQVLVIQQRCRARGRKEFEKFQAAAKAKVAAKATKLHNMKLHSVQLELEEDKELKKLVDERTSVAVGRRKEFATKLQGMTALTRLVRRRTLWKKAKKVRAADAAAAAQAAGASNANL